MSSPNRTEELSLLRDVPFVLLLIGRFLAVMSSVAAPVAIAFGVLESPDGTPTRLSVIMACQAVPLIAFVLIGGVIADRMPRNRVVLIGLTLSTISFGMIGLMLLDGRAPWWFLGVAAVASGIGIAVMNPALAAIVPELVNKEQLHAANSFVGIIRNTARILGVIIAGFLVSLFGGGWSLIIFALCFLVAGTIFGFVRLRYPNQRTGDSTSFITDLRTGWSEFTRQEWLWVVVLQSSLHFACYSAALSVIGPALASAELGGAQPWSWLLACQSTGTLIGAVLAMRWKPRRTILAGVLTTAATMPLSFVLLGLNAPIPLVMVAMVLTGIGMSLLAVLWATTVQTLVPKESLSRVSSYDSLGSMLMSPIALMLAGPAVVLLGERNAMLACGILLIGITTISLVSRDVRTVTLTRTRDMDKTA